MRSLQPVDLADFATAPFQITETLQLAAPPERVFDAFADAGLWVRWWPLMHEARYTAGSGGVGSERVVGLRLFGRFAERFLAWDRGRRFAFTMIATSSPLVARMGEDYQLSADGTGTRLVWTMAAHPRGLGTATTPVTRLVMRRMIRRGIPALDRLLATG